MTAIRWIGAGTLLWIISLLLQLKLSNNISITFFDIFQIKVAPNK